MPKEIKKKIKLNYMRGNVVYVFLQLECAT
jgi:hypothetical protein